MVIKNDVKLGNQVKIFHPNLVNLYGCIIGDETKIGTFVEIQKDAIIGCRCKISSHTFICEGVIIEDEVFIGHGVMFTNDLYPRATTNHGNLQTEADWKVISTRVKRRASVGSHATVLAGVTIGENALSLDIQVFVVKIPPNLWSDYGTEPLECNKDYCTRASGVQ